MLSRNVLYYGKDEPLPQQTVLCAGPLSLVYESGDLRTIKLGEREIVRRIYAAVRDRNWGTVPNWISNEQIEVGGDSFRITYDVENKEGEVHFVWRATITGDAQGTVVFAFDGQALTTFLQCRIGFCILHPLRECAGQPCTVERVDGPPQQATFPQTIVAEQPVQPFAELSAMTYQAAPGVWAELRFSGDIFEMEDQRNWTDASYKTFCTPLRLGYPREIKQGTRVSQSVTLTLKREPGAILPAGRKAADTPLSFALESSSPGHLPSIGLGVASHGQPLTAAELARLKTLGPAHLRVDLTPSQPDCAATLGRVAGEAQALGVPLEIALHLSDAAEDDLQRLAAALESIRPDVRRWAVFHCTQLAAPAALLRLAREHLRRYDPAAQVGGGTDSDFCLLNQSRPPVTALDYVTYAINPQVHAFDNASLVETLEAQAATAQSARRFIGDLPLVVGPVTLKPRYNPYAAAPAVTPPGELPPQVDVRQMSLFGAAWTLGSIKYLAESGEVDSITYYETTGWRGVMETETGSPLPQFPSLAGAVFPLYHVLADVSVLAYSEVVRSASSEPLKVNGLALRKHGRMRILLANLSPAPQRVTVRDIGEQARVLCLDETNVEEAMRMPETFRAQEGELVRPSAGALELSLRPYALVRIGLG